MRTKIVVSALVAVIVVSGIAGLALTGHLVGSTPSTTHDPVFLPEWKGIGQGINASIGWTTIKNVGNGSGLVRFVAIREDTGHATWQTVENQTENVQISPGQTVTFNVSGSYSTQPNYVPYDMVIESSPTATSPSGGFVVQLN